MAHLVDETQLHLLYNRHWHNTISSRSIESRCFLTIIAYLLLVKLTSAFFLFYAD